MTRGIRGRGPANIMKHLKSIHFPADKNMILSHAQKGPGPSTRMVMEILERLPEREYRSPAEIVREVGKLNKPAQPVQELNAT